MKTPTKDQLLENFWYRIGLLHPNDIVYSGTGNPNAKVLVIQPHAKMPERDAITGALNNFGMLDDSYRTTSSIVETKTNRYFLKELIELINPLLIIACGAEVTSLLREKKVREASNYSGKKFKVEDLTNFTFCATINPVDYGFARAPQALKARGKKEWTYISKLYQQLLEKKEQERWT